MAVGHRRELVRSMVTCQNVTTGYQSMAGETSRPRGSASHSGRAQQQRRGPPDHRVRGVLQVHDPWRIPRAGRTGEIPGRRPEPHHAAAGVRPGGPRACPGRGARSGRRTAGWSSAGRPTAPRRPGRGCRRQPVKAASEPCEPRLSPNTSSRGRRSSGSWSMRACTASNSSRPASSGARAVDDERQPARQVRVLGGDDRGVPAPHHLQGVRRSGFDPAGARGGDDGEHRAVERAGALELGDGQGGALLRARAPTSRPT